MLVCLVIAACKSAPHDPEPARLEVFGNASYLCKSGVVPASRLQVELHDREDPQILGTTTTSSTGEFRIETDPLGYNGGRFYLELGGARVAVSGSTRLGYRVTIRLPCPQEEDRVWPASVLSEISPE